MNETPGNTRGLKQQFGFAWKNQDVTVKPDVTQGLGAISFFKLLLLYQFILKFFIKC